MLCSGCSVQSLDCSYGRSRDRQVPSRARCRLIVVRRCSDSFPGRSTPARKPIHVGGSSALRSNPSSAVLLPKVRAKGPIHPPHLADPVLSGLLYGASPSRSGRVRRHRRGGREHVVARARSVAISVFPRRAVTTLDIPHVNELES